MSNSSLLKALSCSNLDRAPVWLMRQAGRYMPAYKELRQKHSLWELFHRPELAAQVTLLPITLLDVDAAILFSDILVITEALGLRVDFPQVGGPCIFPSITNAKESDALPLLSVQEKLSYVFETIAHVKQQLRVPLIGFCGGPFTVATYCIDTTSAHAFAKTLNWIATDPEGFHRFVDKLTDLSIAYLKEQVKAGAEVVQVFDSWANILNPRQFEEFSLRYLQRIVDALRTEAPVIVFCRDSSLRYEAIAKLNPACISLDEHVSMAQARAHIPSSIAIQGNIAPQVLTRSLDEIERSALELLTSMRGEKGFIVNLGHGVLPQTPFENVAHFVRTIKLHG